MPYCPNCAAAIEEVAPRCPNCHAEFGPGSAWKPVPQPPDPPAAAAKPVRRRWSLVALATIAVVTASWFGYGYYARQPTVFEGPGLKFAASPCQESKAPKEGVSSVAWRDGILRIDALMIENCAARVAKGGYSVRGGTIYLSYEASVGMRAACNCAYRLTYDISGVPQASYEIYFPKTGMSLP